MSLASFRLLGVDVRLDGSWIIFALLIAWSLAMGVFPRLHAGLPAFSYWGMAAATVVGVAVSIVLHEFGHTMAGRLFGVRVRSIPLFVFGGVAAMENEPKTASGELVMALAGPVVSAVLAGAFIGGAELALGRVPLSGVRAQRLIVDRRRDRVRCVRPVSPAG
jgi:Zn-dependent protease